MGKSSPQKKQPRFVGVKGGIAVLIAVMSFFGGRELCYSVAARTTDANVMGQATETRSGSRGGLPYSVLAIDYSFTELGGRHRNEHDELPLDPSRKLGQTVKVEYVPGVAGMSRLQGGRHRTAALMILGWCGMMLVLLVGVGLVNAKFAQRVKASPEQPNSIDEKSKSFKTFNAKMLGGSIAGVVGTLVLGISVFGVSDIAGVVISGFMVGLVLVLAIYSNVTDLAARKRAYALRQIARRLRFQFSSQGNDKFHQSLEGFHLATLGIRQRLSNLMHGKIEGTDVAIFDYEYVIPSGKNSRSVSQTVLWLQRRGIKRTEFALRPESFWNAIGIWFGHGDINFESHPTFSRDYLLRGTDESAVRELFNDDVLTFYEQHSGLSTEGAGNKLLVYHAEVLLAPNDITSFLKEALQLLSLLEPTNPS